MNHYADIMRYSRYTLRNHRPMTTENRAAQFSPFAALTGYDEAVAETARLTDTRHELTEDEQDRLNQTMQILADMESKHPVISVTYFQPDARKFGGAYVTVTGKLRFWDEAAMALKLTDGTAIPFANITNIAIREKCRRAETENPTRLGEAD